MALWSLLLLGGETIRGMSYTLFVGAIVGTYSSIFIASPLMWWWYRRYGATFATFATGAGGEAAPSGAQL
jgi:preprotein translocase subunit SecF